MIKYLYPTTQSLLNLPNTGRTMKIICPKHKGGYERTPSFVVYPNGGFKCYGCGIYGKNGLDFLIRVFDKNYSQSLQYLKDKNLLTTLNYMCSDEEIY